MQPWSTYHVEPVSASEVNFFIFVLVMYIVVTSRKHTYVILMPLKPTII